MDKNKIENEWDRVRSRLPEVYETCDVHDLEKISYTFKDALEYLEAVYEESPKYILKKISPLFDPEIRGSLYEYVEELNDHDDI